MGYSEVVDVKNIFKVNSPLTFYNFHRSIFHQILTDLNNVLSSLTEKLFIVKKWRTSRGTGEFTQTFLKELFVTLT